LTLNVPDVNNDRNMPRMSLEIYILEGSKELTSEAGTAYTSGTPPVFSGVRVTRSLVLYVCFVDRHTRHVSVIIYIRYVQGQTI
jgi:hypothetical protein